MALLQKGSDGYKLLVVGKNGNAELLAYQLCISKHEN